MDLLAAGWDAIFSTRGRGGRGAGCVWLDQFFARTYEEVQHKVLLEVKTSSQHAIHLGSRITHMVAESPSMEGVDAEFCPNCHYPE